MANNTPINTPITPQTVTILTLDTGSGVQLPVSALYVGPNASSASLVSSSNPLPVSGTFTPSGTQVVSGTVTAVQATASNLNANVTVANAPSVTVANPVNTVTAVQATASLLNATVAGTVGVSGGTVTAVQATAANLQANVTVANAPTVTVANPVNTVTAVQATATNLQANVTVANAPSVTVANAPSVTVANAPSVTVANAPTVTVANPVNTVTCVQSNASLLNATVSFPAGSITVTPSGGLADATATGSLTDTVGVVSSTFAGYSGAAFVLSGNFTGAVIGEVSADGGTTWNTAYVTKVGTGNPQRWQTNALNPGTYAVLVPEGTGNVRVRCNSYTSGTITVNLRATVVSLSHSPELAVPGEMLPPLVALVGGSDSTHVQAFTVTNGVLSGSEWGLITRNIPSGTQTVDGSGVTQPISGTVTAVQATANNLNANVTVANAPSVTVANSPTVTAVQSGTYTVAQVNENSLNFSTNTVAFNQAVVGIALPGAGTVVAGGTAANPVRIDPTGTTTQPVSVNGTITTTQSGTATVIQAAGSTITCVQATAGNLQANVTVANAPTVTIANPVNTVTTVQATAGNLNATVTGTVAVSGTVTTSPTATQTVAYGSGTFPVSGTVSAVQAAFGSLNASVAGNAPSPTTGSLTTSTSTVSATVANTSGAVVSVSGTYAGITVNFEASDDSGTTWYSVQACRADGSTTETSEALATNASRLWIVYFGALTTFRVRASAYTSGTANVRIAPFYGAAPSQLTAYPVSYSSGTFPVSGTITAVQSGTYTIAPSGTQTVVGSGTAGTAAAGVLTVQGIAGMTAVKVDGSGVTQPVSGTITSVQSGTYTTAPTGTQTVAVSTNTATSFVNASVSIGTVATQLTTAATAVTKGVIVKADAGNSGTVYIGSTTGVTAGTTAATDGFQLAAGDSLSLPISDVSKVYAIGSATGQKVFYVGI